MEDIVKWVSLHTEMSERLEFIYNEYVKRLPKNHPTKGVDGRYRPGYHHFLKVEGKGEARVLVFEYNDVDYGADWTDMPLLYLTHPDTVIEMETLRYENRN